jgi:hypothetical protein
MKKINIEFSQRELELLNHGLGAGISDDSIEHIGLSKEEQAILGTVGNRLLDAAGSGKPRYYDAADRARARAERAAKYRADEEVKRLTRVAAGKAEIEAALKKKGNE